MKKLINHFGTVLLISLFFLQCSRDSAVKIINTNGSQLTVCNASLIKDTIILPLSMLVESCEIVKLETKQEAFFKDAWNTYVTENYIGVRSRGQLPFKLFDRNGNFLRDIGTIGRGPGEYGTLYGEQISEKQNRIYLMPFGTSKKILVYDLKGKNQPDIPLKFTQRKFRAYISEDSIVTVLSMPFQGDSTIAFQQTTDGKLIQKISPEQYMLSQSFDNEIFSFHNANAFDLFNTQIDTLYHYNTKKNILEPEFVLIFNETEKPVHVCYELPLHYYAWVYKKGMVIVDKKELKASYFKLKNDFFGNIDAHMYFNNGMFINNLSAISLKENIKKALENNDMSTEMKEKLIEINNNLKEDDNNVLFIGKLKR